MWNVKSVVKKKCKTCTNENYINKFERRKNENKK